MEETTLLNDFDGPWKEALDQYFEAFLAFFFPVAHAEIDWSRGYESLDSRSPVFFGVFPAGTPGRRASRVFRISVTRLSPVMDLSRSHDAPMAV